MTYMNALLFAMAVIAPVLLWWVIFFELPALAHSAYRNRLWALRDDLVDEIINGTIARTDISLGLVQGIEMLISTSKRQTLLEFATMYRAMRHVPIEAQRNPLDPETYLGDGVPVRDRVALLKYAELVQGAVFRHLETGSLIGLLAWSAAKLPWSRPRAKELARDAYRKEVRSLPTAVQYRMRSAVVA